MSTAAQKLEGTFLAKWTLFTVFACILSLPVSIILPELGVGLLAPACIGAIVAYGQWLVLSKRIKLGGWWIAAGAIGLGVTFPLGFALYEASLLPRVFSDPAGRALGWLIMSVVAGLLIGLLQTPVLRPHFAQASRWVLACAIGWGLVVLAALAIDKLITLASAGVEGNSNVVVAVVTGLTAFVGGLLFSTPLGLATGIGLLWMDRGPKS